MFHVKELMLEIKFQQSFNTKNELIPLLIWFQMCSLTMLLNKFSKIKHHFALFSIIMP